MALYTQTPFSTYTALWQKYRPAILKLMIASAESTQEYKLYGHEFKALNPKARGGYSFTLSVSAGKAVNDIRNSEVAQDLLSVLKESKTALELTNSHTYEISMNKHFVLTLSKVN